MGAVCRLASPLLFDKGVSRLSDAVARHRSPPASAPRRHRQPRPLLRRSRVERYLQQSKRKVTLADPAVAVHVEEAVEREQLREAAPAVGGDAGGGEQRGEERRSAVAFESWRRDLRAGE